MFADQGSRSAFCVSSVNSTESASASYDFSEARIFEIVICQLSKFSSSFTASVETSIVNFQAFMAEGLCSSISQDVHDSNRSFSAPSPAPVDQAPSQSQTDPSVHNPRIGCGPGGETQEPKQVESAASSFLAALCAAGIQVPQGVFLTDRVARESSSAAAQSANAEASQGAQAGVPICLCLFLAC